MLQNIEGVDGVEMARHRSLQHVVHSRIKSPARDHALLDVLNEHRVKVNRRYLSNLGLDDTGSERVPAADLKDVLSSSKHLRNEFVARKTKHQVLGVFVPALAS